MQALLPSFKTLYASLIPRCGSGQYSILRGRGEKKEKEVTELVKKMVSTEQITSTFSLEW